MGFFKDLFKKPEPKEPIDVGRLVNDVHSHFIPGIDDGAQTVEDSLALMQAFQDLGYSKIITTPHVMSDHYRNTADIILTGLDTVRKASQEVGLSIQIEAAAEYYLDSELEGLIERKEVLTFGDNYLLFELPFISEPAILDNTIFNMQTSGYRPVLAHPARYSFWHNQYERYQDLYEKGVILQLNLGSILGAYGPGVKRTAEKLIDDGMVRLVGSDCHNMGHVPMLQEALKEPYLHKLLESGSLLNDQL